MLAVEVPRHRSHRISGHDQLLMDTQPRQARSYVRMGKTRWYARYRRTPWQADMMSLVSSVQPTTRLDAEKNTWVTLRGKSHDRVADQHAHAGKAGSIHRLRWPCRQYPAYRST